MLKIPTTTTSRAISPGMNLLRAVCAVCTVLLISIVPTLQIPDGSLAPESAALEKTSGLASESSRTGELLVLLPIAVSICSPRLQALEQTTNYVCELTQQKHATNGAARAPPLSA